MRTGAQKSDRSFLRRLLARAAVAFLLAATAVVVPVSQASADVEFEGWTFDWDLNFRHDGVSLNNVVYNGTKILERISMPAMLVYYENDHCGPYLDLLGPVTIEGDVVAEEFTQNGTRWFSIGMTAHVGNYVITQMFYLSEHGHLDAHMFSKGLQCDVYHEHYPHWRMDFDLAGQGAFDVVKRTTGSGEVTATREFSLPATAAVDHSWEVANTLTGDFVTIQFDDGGFDIGGEVVPETDYEENAVFARQYHSSEQAWGGATNTNEPVFENNELISDLVFWYRGYMPHWVEEGPDLWHSTGIRLSVNGAEEPTPENPEPEQPEPVYIDAEVWPQAWGSWRPVLTNEPQIIVPEGTEAKVVGIRFPDWLPSWEWIYDLSAGYFLYDAERAGPGQEVHYAKRDGWFWFEDADGNTKPRERGTYWIYAPNSPLALSQAIVRYQLIPVSD